MCKQLERPPRSGGPVNLGYDISQVTGAESQTQLDAVIEEYVPKVSVWCSLCKMYIYKYIILSSCCECMWETGQCVFTVFSYASPLFPHPLSSPLSPSLPLLLHFLLPLSPPLPSPLPQPVGLHSHKEAIEANAYPAPREKD